MKREASDHPKLWDFVGMLPDAYANRGCAVGFLEVLWHFTAQFTPRGDIGAKTDIAICRWLGWPLEPEILMKALVESHWVDAHDEHRLIVHDWPEHADDAVHRKLARARMHFADGSIPKLTRLGEVERKRAKAFYVNTGVTDVRTLGAHQAHGGHPAPPRPAPPEPEPKKRTDVCEEATDGNQRIDSVKEAWGKGIEAASAYRPPDSKPWKLTVPFRRSVNQLLRDHPDTGVLVFAQVVHGYRYARRGWAKVDTYFHPKTILRPANREEYLAAYHDAVSHGLSPPFQEPGDDSRVSQTRRVARGIEEQIDDARRKGTAPTGRNEPGGAAGPPGDPSPPVRGVPADG